jgi:SAM-dependent methyltransferase
MKNTDLVSAFFARFPVCHALPRANEALAIRETELKQPILDLGCGDGLFADFTFGRGIIEVGLDPNPQEAKKAKNIGVYKKVVVANGAQMPFKDDTFGTVISNSVLEHVGDLNEVLAEVYRVLKKNGLFIFTVPTPLVSDYQYWSKFVPGYAEFKRRLWQHINYFDEAEWRKRLAKIGFTKPTIKRTNSRAAIVWADIFFPFIIFGPMKWSVSLLRRKKAFGWDSGGATLVVVAEK